MVGGDWQCGLSVDNPVECAELPFHRNQALTEYLQAAVLQQSGTAAGLFTRG
jgi:hypothetical protein